MKSHIHRQPINIQVVSWMLLILFTIFFLVMPILALRSEDGGSWLPILGMVLLFGPFYVAAWWAVWRFSGRFMLDDKGITWQHLGRETSLNYAEIIELKERDSQFIPYLLVRTQAERLHIYAGTERFTDLYHELKERAAQVHREIADEFPMMLRIHRSFYRDNAVLFLFIMALIGVPTVVATTANENARLLDAAWVIGPLALVILLAFVLAELGFPIALDLRPDRIEGRSWFGRRRAWPAQAISRIVRRKRVDSYKGFKKITYPILIEFSESGSMEISEKRAWTFGYAPERLFLILRRLYEYDSVNVRLNETRDGNNRTRSPTSRSAGRRGCREPSLTTGPPARRQAPKR